MRGLIHATEHAITNLVERSTKGLADVTIPMRYNTKLQSYCSGLGCRKTRAIHVGARRSRRLAVEGFIG